jgi:anti-sigma B factor antagonist
MADRTLEINMADGRRSGEKIIALEGVLTAETAFRLRDAVRQLVPKTLVIDMHGVRHMDSSGLGVLIGIYVSSEQNSRHLLLVGLNDRVWDVLRKCKIDDVFTRYATLADAEQAVAQFDQKLSVTPVVK